MLTSARDLVGTGGKLCSFAHERVAGSELTGINN